MVACCARMVYTRTTYTSTRTYTLCNSCILAGLSCTWYWLHTRLTASSGVVSLPSASSFTVSLRGCSVVRRRGRRSTHAWPRMAVFSSFAFLSFGRTSSRLTADQREISYGTREPGIFAPHPVPPTKFCTVEKEQGESKYTATI